MKKLIIVFLALIFAAGFAHAGPNFSAGGGGGSATVTISTDCSGTTAEGEMCWDSDNDTFYIGSGVAAVDVGPGSSSGDITDVWNVNTGNVNALTAAAGDSFNASAGDSSVPFVHATDCSAVVAEGRTCWDTDDNILYVGDGTTQVKIIKSGAIVNADIAAAAAIAFSKLAALTAGNIIVGNVSDVATSVAMSGDATMSNAGALTIGANKILESHLKAVDSATDEDILTYESTTGDFEWHTTAQVLENIGTTQGSVLYRSDTAWTVLTPGTSGLPLLSQGVAANPTYGTIATGAITDNTITATDLSATLTFADGDIVDLGSITHTGSADEGLVLPTWANVTPVSDKKFLAADGSTLKLYNGGWVSIGATAAPTDARYIVQQPDATLTQEQALSALANGILYNTTTTGVLSIATESQLETTLGIGFGTSKAVTAGYIPVADGTDLEMVATSGDATISSTGAITIGADRVNDTHIDWGTGANQVSLDDVTDGSNFQKVAAADVDASGHVNVFTDIDLTGAITITGLTATRAKTISDAVDTIAEVGQANTFTANNTFGNGDTDTLTIRSLLVGGNSRALWIAGSAPTPSYATANNELYVAGDIETAGTVYASSFSAGTGTDGQRRIDFTSNTTFTPSGNQMYFLNNVAKVSENGTERDIVTPVDSVTWTGTSHSFTGVTNLTIPTATPDANNEIGINNTNETFLMYINSGLKSFDFTGDSSGYVLKSDGAGNFTLQADATAGSPTLNSIGNPTADTTIAFDINEEVNWQFTGNYTTGSQFLIQQLTGNPSGGVLFEVRAADSDSVLARFGDGTNYLQISQAGNISHAGTSAFSGITVADSGILTFDESAVDPNDADIQLSATDGVFKIASANGANNEDITIDLDQTANTAIISSSTGLTLITTGSIPLNGAIKVVAKSADYTIGTDNTNEAYGAIFFNTAASTRTFTLPSAVAGMSVCIKNDQGVAQILRLDANTGDYIVKETGARTSASAEYYGSTADAGAQLCVVAYDATDWHVTSVRGTWTEE